MKKRVFSLFLVLVMALSLCVTTAWADEHTNHCVCAGNYTGTYHTCATNTIWTAWNETTSLPTEVGNYYLTSDVTVTEQWNVNANITLCLNGHNIKRTDTSSTNSDFINVDNSGVTLTLTDCAGIGTVQGGMHIVRIVSGTFNMYGGKITGKTAEGFGAVCLGNTDGTKSATFNMYGGTISDNNANGKNGGGVHVSNNSTFNMYGGTIKDNKAPNGSGAGVSNDGTFNMYGGTISDNECVNGGGVFSSADATFNMYGGTISNNKATGTQYGNGGGVSLQGEFNMYGGTISDNSASQHGGGVYVRGDATFNLKGGSIIDNTCENNDGGSAVHIDNHAAYPNTVVNGTMNATGGTVDGTINVAGDAKFTGAVNGNVTVTGATITTYTVTFNSNGGSEVPKQTVFGDDAKATKPTDPTREGFTFAGWLNEDGNDYDFDAVVENNLTLTAKWEEIPAEPEEDAAPSHTPIRRQNTTTATTEAATTDTTKTDTVTSAKTFDVGTAVYGVLAVTSLLGIGYVGKKR